MDDATFRFKDIDADRVVSGVLSATLAKSIRRGENEATVGVTTRYVARIANKADSPELLEFRGAQGLLF